MRIIEADLCNDHRICGGKAMGLHLLLRSGLRVPEFFVVTMEAEDTTQSSLNADIWASIVNRAQNLGAHDNSGLLAIRSSALVEDSKLASYAGHFKTLCGRFRRTGIVDAITEVAKAFPAGQGVIPVIVQEFVEAEYGGVGFSCHPVSLRRDMSLLNWTAGGAQSIVQGTGRGESTVLEVRNGIKLLDESWPPFGEALTCELVEGMRCMEMVLGLPVDCEWGIDTAGILYWLQCRPVASISHAFFTKISLATHEQLPARCRAHHKVGLRIEAERLGVEISPGYLTAAGPNGGAKVPILQLPTGMGDDQSYSVVLIHPEKANGQIIRRFSPKDSLETVVGEVLGLGASEVWQPIAICQEIWKPIVTGIVAKESDKIVVEMAQGHFVPKGVVAVSRIVLLGGGEVAEMILRFQNEAYDIVDGCPVIIPVDKQLDEEQLLGFGRLVQIELAPALEIRGRLVEFGILDRGDQGWVPYLIDIAEERNSGALISAGDGIISPGRAHGILVDWRKRSVDQSALEHHLYSEVEQLPDSGESVVLFMSRPDLSFIELLKLHRRPGLGVVFEEAAILSHFSVLLREYGIPAIEIGRVDLPIAQEVELDAETPGLRPLERVRWIKQGVG